MERFLKPVVTGKVVPGALVAVPPGGSPVGCVFATEGKRRPLFRYFRLSQDVQLKGNPRICSGWRLDDKGGGFFVVHSLEEEKEEEEEGMEETKKGRRSGGKNWQLVGTLVLAGPPDIGQCEVALHVTDHAGRKERVAQRFAEHHGGTQKCIRPFDREETERVRPEVLKDIRSRGAIKTYHSKGQHVATASSSSSSSPPPTAPSAPPAPWDPVHGPHLSLADLADARLPSDEELGRAVRQVPPQRQEDLRRVAAFLESVPSPPQQQQKEQNAMPLLDGPLHPCSFLYVVTAALRCKFAADEVLLVKRCAEAPRCAWYAHLPGDPSHPVHLFCVW